MKAAIKELKKEIEEIKNYLSKLIEISLKEIEEVEPEEEEKKIFSGEIKEEDYLDWDSVKNEI